MTKLNEVAEDSVRALDHSVGTERTETVHLLGYLLGYEVKRRITVCSFADATLGLGFPGFRALRPDLHIINYR